MSFRGGMAHPPEPSDAVGPRNLAAGQAMWDAIPAGYRRKQVTTDACPRYDELIPWSPHRVCPKGSGDTCIAEGCIIYVCHRVSYLVRKSMSFARSVDWLKRRLLWVLFARNKRIKAKAG